MTTFELIVVAGIGCVVIQLFAVLIGLGQIRVAIERLSADGGFR